MLRGFVQPRQITNVGIHPRNQAKIRKFWLSILVESLTYKLLNLCQEGFEASTTSWSVLHMYILDENLDYAVGGYVNYGQER